MTIAQQLAAPFPPDKVSWRVGSTTQDKAKGLAFAYIDARDVMQRLDDVCGPENWQDRYPHATAKTVCEIGSRVGRGNGTFEWVWKSDGAGDADVEAEKGALSDAFKRAAVRWGIGRYLYDIDATWVEVEARGRSYSIKQSEYAKLRRALSGNVVPASQAPSARSVPTDNVALDSMTLANDLVREIKDRGDAASLKAWGTDPRNKSRIEGLGTADQSRVRETYRQKLLSFDKNADLRMAG